MDSLSQIALGAAIGEATLGRKLGRSAALVGGALGTLPDLDVLMQYTDAVESFTFHRSWSHSIFVLGIVAPLVAVALHKLFPTRWIRPHSTQHRTSSNGQPQRPSYALWLLCCALVLLTHPLLDAMTVYGTQLLWPMQSTPVAWGSIFIIDPLYTLPLLIALWVAWKKRHKAQAAAIAGLVISTGYLGVTLAAQAHTRDLAIASLEQQGIASDHVLVAPTPMSLLWRVVAFETEQYHEGFYSLLDNNNEIAFKSFPSGRQWIESARDHWPVQQLEWFTDGMISASVTDDRLIINDLRMGVESSYIFRFDVGSLDSYESLGSKPSSNTALPFTPETSVLLPPEIEFDRIKALIKRVGNDSGYPTY